MHEDGRNLYELSDSRTQWSALRVFGQQARKEAEISSETRVNSEPPHVGSYFFRIAPIRGNLAQAGTDRSGTALAFGEFDRSRTMIAGNCFRTKSTSASVL
jgi:hypothetical protein